MTVDTMNAKALFAPGRPPRRLRARRRRRQPLWRRLYRMLSSLVVGGLLVGCASQAGTRVVTNVTDPVAALQTAVDPQVRMAAYRKLAAARRPMAEEPATVALLAHGAEHESSAIARCAAVAALGRYADPAARAALEKSARDPDPLVRAETCRALGRRDDDPGRRLLGQLAAEDEHSDVRIAAAQALAAQKNPAAAPLLLPCLTDHDFAVASAAHAGLQQITGAKLPLSHDAWAEHLGPGSTTPRLARPAPRVAKPHLR